MTDEVRKVETREVVHSGDNVIERSQTIDMIAQAALGGGGAYVAGKVVGAVERIITNHQSTQRDVEVARIENGYPQQGGAHRAED